MRNGSGGGPGQWLRFRCSLVIGLRGSRFRVFALPGRLAVLLVVDADRFLQTLPTNWSVLQEAALEGDGYGFTFFLAPRARFVFLVGADRNIHREILLNRVSVSTATATRSVADAKRKNTQSFGKKRLHSQHRSNGDQSTGR